jgi:hypothetical protein
MIYICKKKKKKINMKISGNSKTRYHFVNVCNPPWFGIHFSGYCSTSSVPVLFLTEHHAMKAYWESGGIASRPSHFTSQGKSPGTHWIGGWVGPRTVLDAVVKRKIPCPRRESKIVTLQTNKRLVLIGILRVQTEPYTF